MFLTYTKTVLVEAVKRTFDEDFPEATLRGLHVTMEYPDKETHFPGIWVDFEVTQELRTAGIAHVEWGPAGPSGDRRAFHRWRFAGLAQFTIVALTSFERDRIVDALVRTIAFGSEQPQTSEFRRYIEDNEFIGMTFDWDKIQFTGKSESPGTPWEGPEVVYEQTIQVTCIGEFTSSGSTDTFVPISAVLASVRVEGEPDTTEPEPQQPDDGWV